MTKDKESMHIQANDVIGYKGEITLQVSHGDKVVKTIKLNNNGHQPLFEFLMYCLAGNYKKEKAPKYLRVYNANDVDITTRPVLSTSTPIYTDNTTNCAVTLSFVVPYSLLKQYTNIKYLKIYSEEKYNDASSPSATLELDTSLTISSTSNLMVAWKMIVGNA